MPAHDHGPEPSNADIMAELKKIHRRLDRGDARFRKIDMTLEDLDGVAAAASMIVQAAETYKLIGLGGKVTIWIAKVLGAVGVIVMAVLAARQWMHEGGGQPPVG